jgi:PAS domain S-box-containing protein
MVFVDLLFVLSILFLFISLFLLLLGYRRRSRGIDGSGVTTIPRLSSTLIDESLVLVDSNHRCLSSNEQFLILCKPGVEDARGKSFEELLPAKLAETLQRHLDLAIRRGDGLPEIELLGIGEDDAAYRLSIGPADAGNYLLSLKNISREERENQERYRAELLRDGLEALSGLRNAYEVPAELMMLLQDMLDSAYLILYMSHEKSAVNYAEHHAGRRTAGECDVSPLDIFHRLAGRVPENPIDMIKTFSIGEETDIDLPGGENWNRREYAHGTALFRREGDASLTLFAARRTHAFARRELEECRVFLGALVDRVRSLRSQTDAQNDRQIVEGIFRSSSLGLMECDSSGRIYRINTAAAALIGSGARSTPSNLYELISSDQHHLCSNIFNQSPDSTEAEFRIEGPGGEDRWIRIRGMPTSNDESAKPHRILLIIENASVNRTMDQQTKEMNDLLELKVLVRTEELEIAMEKIQEREMALRESEQRFKNVVNAMNDMIFTTDTRHYITGVFGTWHSQFTFQREDELIGESIGRVFQLPSEMIEHSFIQLETNEKGIVEWDLMDRGGSQRTYLIAISQLRDQSDVLIGYLVVGREITRRIRAERALEAAKEEAERANQAKSEFLANMSHEIRTPMNAVLGYTQILNELISDEKQRNYIEIIEKAGRSLLQLINDVLDLSKIEAGKMPINPGWLSVPRLLEEIEGIFRIRVDEKSLFLVVESADDIPERIMADESRLRQILVNLVGNAVKFTESGGIKISTDFEQLDENHISLSISVQDTGIGISRDEQDVIFDSFKQQEGQSSRKYGGTGLGLAISRKLSRLMGGTLTVDSEKGNGSTFTLSLESVEIDSDTNLPPENRENQEKVQFTGERILAVDDVQTNLLLLQHILTSAGARVITADSGQAAIDLVERDSVDLIIMDIRMPGMDGRTAASRIREIPAYRNTPIIALTASVSITREKNHQNTFDGWAYKPFKAHELLRTIHQFLNRPAESSAMRNFGQRLWDEYREFPEELRTVHQKHIEDKVILPARRLVQSMTLGEAREYLEELEAVSKTLDWPALRQLSGELASAVKTYRIDIVREKIHFLSEGTDGK